jgi:type II secretory pathway predicted ATPase ExeA
VARYLVIGGTPKARLHLDDLLNGHTKNWQKLQLAEFRELRKRLNGRIDWDIPFHPG